MPLVLRTLAFSLTVTAAMAALLFVLPVADSPAHFTAADTDAGRRTAAGEAMVIEGASWFDGEQLHPPSRVVVRDGRIAAIDTAMGTPPPAGARRIDGRGHTLLPGLVDAHVHSFGSARRDALRFGVTTLIDMFTAPSLLEGVREERASFDARDMAALWSAGMLATVEKGHGTQYGVPVDVITGPDDAAGWVAARLAEGSDFIKLVYIPEARSLPSLDLATAEAIIDAAHAAGVMAVAHISSRDAAADLVAAGIDGLVHVFADTPADTAFVEAARAAGIFVVPTLAVIAAVDGRSTGPSLIDDAHLGPRLDALQRSGLRGGFGRAPSRTFDLDTAMENVRRLHEAGVPILAGSDAPNPGTAHGATLHAELELLVRAGLTPAEALAAATSVPARIFGARGRGRIAPGAHADLVLVAGDPTADILATRALAGVYRNGRLVDTAAERASPGADTAMEVPARLGDFERGLDAPSGFVWGPTSDEMMGGASLARLEHVPGEHDGVLAVQASVVRDFPWPWAGAWFGPATRGEVADLGSTTAIAFDVRGTPATYRLMLFGGGTVGAPPTAEFEVDERWRRIEIPLERFPDFPADRFAGMAFVSPATPGEYRFDLDDVTLIR
jgi:imidazolonepropionase-like amidohydrolase